MQPYPMPGRERYSFGINWVEGLQEVSSVELPPGGSAVFIDKVNDGMMYLKTRDTFNVYNTRVFKMEEVPQQPPVGGDYVTRKELEELFQKFLGGAQQNDTLRTDDIQPEPSATTNGTTAASAMYADVTTNGSKRKTDDANTTRSKRS